MLYASTHAPLAQPHYKLTTKDNQRTVQNPYVSINSQGEYNTPPKQATVAHGASQDEGVPPPKKHHPESFSAMLESYHANATPATKHRPHHWSRTIHKSVQDMPGSTSTSRQLFSEPTQKKRQYSKKAASTAEKLRTQKHEPLDTMHVHKELAVQHHMSKQALEKAQNASDEPSPQQLVQAFISRNAAVQDNIFTASSAQHHTSNVRFQQRAHDSSGCLGQYAIINDMSCKSFREIEMRVSELYNTLHPNSGPKFFNRIYDASRSSHLAEYR